MSLEKSWKEEVRRMQTRGQHESYSWIMAGSLVVQMYNSGVVDKDEYIYFVPMVSADTINHS